MSRVCIVGGGASGVSLFWTLAQDKRARQEWEITLIHNQPKLGGHSLTYPVQHNGKTLEVDIGVQFISPLLYPNVHDMLKRSEFKSRVPVFDYKELTIACAFPQSGNGQPMNWGNFAPYQSGSDFGLYDQGREDCLLFQAFLELCIPAGWANTTLQEFFDSPPIKLNNPELFSNYFLKPYLSVINGYGAALMDQTTFGDLFPLFATLPLPKAWGLPTPLGAFTKPGVGWQRFTNGAQSWVQAVAEVALGLTSATILTSCCAQVVWTDPATGKVTVQWVDEQQAQHQETFDKVVLTTDMWTNSLLLNNPNNQHFWDSLYEKYVGYAEKYEGPGPTNAQLCDPPNAQYGPAPVWPLMWGMCYIHTDSSMLSPDLMQQQETLQFNAYYAPGSADGNYELAKTFTTYIQKNVLEDPDAEGLYLTMYGFVPDAKSDKVPDPEKVLFQEPWTHGKWTPAFMSGPKGELHLAQGLGNISFPGQMDTNVYFAGNNATADSEEGALDAAMVIADYAFGVSYPLASLNPLAWFMYLTYHNVMFPRHNAAGHLPMMYSLLGHTATAAAS